MARAGRGALRLPFDAWGISAARLLVWRLVRDDRAAGAPPGARPVGRRRPRGVVAVLRTSVEAAGGRLLDLHDALADEEFRDRGGHFNAAGAAHMASLVAPALAGPTPAALADEVPTAQHAERPDAAP